MDIKKPLRIQSAANNKQEVQFNLTSIKLLLIPKLKLLRSESECLNQAKKSHLTQLTT